MKNPRGLGTKRTFFNVVVVDTTVVVGATVGTGASVVGVGLLGSSVVVTAGMLVVGSTTVVVGATGSGSAKVEMGTGAATTFAVSFDTICELVMPGYA